MLHRFRTEATPAALGLGVAPNASAPDVAREMRLRSATVEYYRAGPVDPVVELRIILQNTGRRHTDSTTITWDPSFAQNFTFLDSDPPPWRVRTDVSGWGTLDTSGVLPNQFGTFKLHFAIGTYAPQEPQIRVISNGNVVVGEALAEALHLRWQQPSAAQRTFEHGALGTLASIGTILPEGPHAGFLFAVLLALSLTIATSAGSVVALKQVSAHAHSSWSRTMMTAAGARPSDPPSPARTLSPTPRVARRDDAPHAQGASQP
jgi:hypothetical protein